MEVEPVLHVVPGGEDGESGDPVSFLENPKMTVDVAFDVLPGAGVSGGISGIITVEVAQVVSDLLRMRRQRLEKQIRELKA